MSNIIGIVGPSGSGKTRSTKGLDPKSTYYINCDLKSLPFEDQDQYSEANKNYFATSDVEKIKQIIIGISDKRPDIKSIIIDTVNAIMINKEMSDEFVSRQKGSEAQKKWLELAMDIYNLNHIVKLLGRKDLVVYEMFHEGIKTISLPDGSSYDTRYILTNGRKLEKIVLEAGMPVVLFTSMGRDINTGKRKYGFETVAMYSTAKSPEGMFNEEIIENDLGLVDKEIRKFFKLS